MGCCQGNDRTLCIDDVLSKIPIRHVSMKSFFENFDNNEPITQTKFQVIINDYLLLKESLYPNHRVILFDYWYDMYNGLQSRNRSEYLKFMLGMLCKKGKNEQEAIILDEYLTIKDGVMKETGQEKYITKTMLKKILKNYIQLITVDTIKHFKYFSMNPEVFQKELEEEWEIQAIDGFIDEEFHGSLPKDGSRHNLVKGKDFFIDNLDLLKDDERLRMKFKTYSMKYRNINHKYLEIHEHISPVKEYYY